jgi:hypothetical protein
MRNPFTDPRIEPWIRSKLFQISAPRKRNFGGNHNEGLCRQRKCYGFQTTVEMRGNTCKFFGSMIGPTPVSTHVCLLHTAQPKSIQILLGTGSPGAKSAQGAIWRYRSCTGVRGLQTDRPRLT